MADQQEDGLIT